MINDNYVDFLRDRINEIRSAIFFNLSNSPFKLPTAIISVLKTDQQGQIWFFLPAPEMHLEEEDFIFPARLDFYRKGKSFYLTVNGTANATFDLENTGLCDELPGLESEIACKRFLLIKLKIACVEYSEKVTKVKNWLDNTLIHFFDSCQNLFSAFVRKIKEVYYENLKNTAWRF
jgi:hypothetical protein